MKKVRYRVEYAVVRIVDGLIRLAPRWAAMAAGALLGWIFSKILRRRNKLVMDNLQASLPGVGMEERRKIAGRMWRNLGWMAVEFVRLPALLEKRVEEWAVCDQLPLLARLKQDKRGVIFVASHFTNWEINGMFLGLHMKDFIAIARPMKNPLVEKWLQDRRRAAGSQTILHRQAVKATFRWLKQKKSVGILVDQNLYLGGIFADFLGRPAATTTLPALLHLRTGAPIVFTSVWREGDKFRFKIDDPFVFPRFENDEEAILEITRKINEKIGDIIKKAPENWFWVHNRWKRKPTN